MYQFVDKLNDYKDYFGMTVDFQRRIAQHAGRVLKGTQDDIVKFIPKRSTAKGVEQLFIEYGKKVGAISNEINSVNPKAKHYKEGISSVIKF